MVRQTAQDIGEPGARIDIIEPTGLDQGVHRGSPMAALVRAGKRPVLAPDRNAADRPFGCVVRQADASVVEKARKGWPALEHVVDRLRGLILGREPSPLETQPGLQIVNKRLGTLTPDR